MSEIKEKYQQQILFDETELTKKSDQELTMQEQVIVDNNDWQIVEAEDELTHDFAPKSTKPSWLWRAIGGVFGLVVTIEAIDFFRVGFTQSPLLASLYGFLLFCLTLVVGRTAYREFSGLRQFKQQQKQQQQAKNVFDENIEIDAKELCSKISANLPCDLMSEYEDKWQKLQKEEYSNAEVLQLYSREVLSKVDEKALAEVSKFSTEAVVLVALSPIAIVDMMLLFWRNLRMIDKISSLYGLKIGYWSRIKLIKQIFVNMAYAGASELVVDLGADLLGADMLGKLSSRLAQGLGAGMLTSRLGIKAIQLSRPIPFDGNSPKIGEVRKQILSQVKQLLLKNKS